MVLELKSKKDIFSGIFKRFALKMLVFQIGRNRPPISADISVVGARDKAYSDPQSMKFRLMKVVFSYDTYIKTYP